MCSLLTSLRKENRGFPGCVVVKNLPARAGDTGLIPGPGRSNVPLSNQGRVPRLLSALSGAPPPRAAATEPAHPPEARLPRAAARWEGHAPPRKATPACHTSGKPLTQQRRPSTAENKRLHKKRKEHRCEDTPPQGRGHRLEGEDSEPLWVFLSVR